MNWRPVAIVAAWAAGALVTLRFDPAAIQLYLIISIFALILTNLGTRRTGPSAYSVFNKNCATLPGQLRAEQFDDEVRHRPVYVSIYSPRILLSCVVTVQLTHFFMPM